jgi:H+/Cl- antiporter ClcA
MSEAPGRKPVTAIEPVLLLIAVAVFAGVVAHGLITGWVWIPGSRRGGGVGHWANRTDQLWDYVVYLIIMGAATLGVLVMALDRLRKFNEQGAGRR